MSFLKRWFARQDAAVIALVNASAPAADAAAARLPARWGRALGGEYERLYVLTSCSDIDVPADAPTPTVNVFAAIESWRPTLVVIGRELNLLLANAFTLAWLARCCAALAPGGRVLLELPAASAKAPHSPRLTRICLAEYADVFSIDEEGSGWCSVTLTPAFADAIAQDGFARTAATRFDTVLPLLAGAWQEFSTRYREAHAGYIDPERLQPEFAARQFIYTLHGTSQKSRFLEWAATAGRSERPLRILDMGGGYGAMGIELALHGHDVTILELEPAKVEHIGRWLAQLTGVGARVKFEIGNFDAIDRIEGPFDVISFFGSLLYYPHARTCDLLQRCSARLVAGGCLLVHENPRERASPDALDYDNQFMADELDGIVRGVLPQLSWYSIFDYQEIDLAAAAGGLLLGVARKAAEGAA